MRRETWWHKENVVGLGVRVVSSPGSIRHEDLTEEFIFDGKLFKNKIHPTKSKNQ